jgi:hypothetical protein
MSSADLPPWRQYTSRRGDMRSIDQIRSAVGSARRSGARALFRFANSVLHCSVGLYERHMIPLRAALAAVRILERSAAILLFGYRSHNGRKYLNRNHWR